VVRKWELVGKAQSLGVLEEEEEEEEEPESLQREYE
jgi:hypothetical protein